MKLSGKTVIITGATAGIGRACAKLFAKEGAEVVAAGRNEAKGNSLVEEIIADGGSAIFVKTDVTVEADLDNLVEKAIEKYGKIDVLFNNAGISYAVPLEEFEQDKYDGVVSLNLRAPFVLTKKVIPYLLKTKGNILNTSSIAGLKGTPMAYAYGASKYGVVGFTKALALDYAKQGVRANALCPGITLTEILNTVPEDTMEGLKASIPMGRLAEAEEMAKAALFLVSDDASYITGQTIAVDGGFTV